MKGETAMAQHPPQHPQALESQYFAALRAGRFEIPRCLDCHRTHFYPRVLCPVCGSERIAWIRATGRGTVYGATVVRPRTERPFCAALIDLEEGPRMLSRVLADPPESVRIGARVVLSQHRLEETHPQFELASDADSVRGPVCQA